jgi:hypothetical protein
MAPCGVVWCGWEVIWRFRTGVKGVVWNGALGASGGERWWVTYVPCLVRGAAWCHWDICR